MRPGSFHEESFEKRKIIPGNSKLSLNSIKETEAPVPLVREWEESEEIDALWEISSSQEKCMDSKHVKYFFFFLRKLPEEL